MSWGAQFEFEGSTVIEEGDPTNNWYVAWWLIV